MDPRKEMHSNTGYLSGYLEKLQFWQFSVLRLGVMLTVPPTLNFSINACRAGETGRGLVHRPEAKNFKHSGVWHNSFPDIRPHKKGNKKKKKKLWLNHKEGVLLTTFKKMLQCD